ncbi:MAG: HAD family hydrolase [Chloroflexota bacterium]|nr:HAD family hydrolase [Chloroflexota bacterium]
MRQSKNCAAPRRIRAIIFDFDGLILDTEMPAFQSWQELFAEHGQHLPLEVWARAIGASLAEFDTAVHLQELVGLPLDLDALRAARLARKVELLAEADALPGVREYIAGARRLGLRLAIATSSGRGWADAQLARLGLLEAFEAIVCADDVQAAKPDPALFLAALRRLGVTADEAIAIEDSPNGITAARAAGIFCVAVPNELTLQLGVDHADLVLSSLEEMPLKELLVRATRPGTSR